jgi:hypothetical protein
MDDKTLAQIQQNARRYETVKRMSMRAFGEAYHRSLATGQPLDAILDDVGEAFAQLDANAPPSRENN